MVAALGQAPGESAADFSGEEDVHAVTVTTTAAPALEESDNDTTLLAPASAELAQLIHA
ncbi:MAG: hypothetical protein OSA97_13125 [Nevskia sp.]|nr:hypothetical protein [Nevskia sp.]